MASPSFYPAPQGSLVPLRMGSPEYQAAWRDYQAASKGVYIKGPLDGTTHLIWFLAGLFTFGLGWVGWLIHVCVGKPMVRPGMYAPPWPPAGYYIAR